MGRIPEMAVPIGQKIYNNGVEVVAVIQQPEPGPYDHIQPGKTAIYEARHIVVAKERNKGVKGATVIPNPNAGYKGATWLDEFDPVAANVHPGDGDGHDRMVTILSGHNPDASAAAASEIINRRAKRVLWMAKALQAKGTVGRSEIDTELEAADRKPEQKAMLVIRTVKGESERVSNIKVENGFANIPNKWVNSYIKQPVSDDARFAGVKLELAELPLAA